MGSWSPPQQGPSSPIAQFGWMPSSRKSHGGFKLLPFKNDGGHCIFGDLQWSRNVLVPFPRSVLYGPFLQPHDLVLALTCTVNCGTLYRQVCAFPNHVQSIEFTTGWLQLSCRNSSRMINGNRMHLSSISSLIAKGLNSVNKVFIWINFQTFLKTCFRFVIMVYCVSIDNGEK